MPQIYKYHSCTHIPEKLRYRPLWGGGQDTAWWQGHRPGPDRSLATGPIPQGSPGQSRGLEMRYRGGPWRMASWGVSIPAGPWERLLQSQRSWGPDTLRAGTPRYSQWSQWDQPRLSSDAFCQAAGHRLVARLVPEPLAPPLLMWLPEEDARPGTLLSLRTVHLHIKYILLAGDGHV